MYNDSNYLYIYMINISISSNLHINLFRIHFPKWNDTHGLIHSQQTPQGQPITTPDTPLHDILVSNVDMIHGSSIATSSARYA